MADFTGYPKTALPLLTEIGDHGKAWFDEHKDKYLDQLAEPTKAFVSDLGDELRSEISGELSAVPRVNGSISPISNDVRFAKDRPPYKDNILLRFWEGPKKQTAPTLFVRLSQNSIAFASGIAMDKPELERWREQVAGKPGEDLTKILDHLMRSTAKNGEIVGAELKRVPKPYDQDHPRSDLLKHKYLQLRWQEPTPKSVGNSRFVDWCARRLANLSDLHHWLTDNI